MKDPATGSTFWLKLDPGQRERGSRKGRVKEAESTAATFFCSALCQRRARLRLQSHPDRCFSRVRSRTFSCFMHNRTLDDLPNPVVSLWPRREGRSTAGSLPARFDSAEKMKSSPPQKVSTFRIAFLAVGDCGAALRGLAREAIRLRHGALSFVVFTG